MTSNTTPAVAEAHEGNNRFQYCLDFLTDILGTMTLIEKINSELSENSQWKYAYSLEVQDAEIIFTKIEKKSIGKSMREVKTQDRILSTKRLIKTFQEHKDLLSEGTQNLLREEWKKLEQMYVDSLIAEYVCEHKRRVIEAVREAPEDSAEERQSVTLREALCDLVPRLQGDLRSRFLLCYNNGNEAMDKMIIECDREQLSNFINDVWPEKFFEVVRYIGTDNFIEVFQKVNREKLMYFLDYVAPQKMSIFFKQWDIGNTITFLNEVDIGRLCSILNMMSEKELINFQETLHSRRWIPNRYHLWTLINEVGDTEKLYDILKQERNILCKIYDVTPFKSLLQLVRGSCSQDLLWAIQEIEGSYLNALIVHIGVLKIAVMLNRLNKLQFRAFIDNYCISVKYDKLESNFDEIVEFLSTKTPNQITRIVQRVKWWWKFQGFWGEF